MVRTQNKISILITAWKSEEYIEQCLDSIENQTYKNYEIILGIDGCEKVLEKIEQIKDKYSNLKVVYMNDNNGWTIAFNTLYKLCKSKWILRFDSDDYMNPDMLQQLNTTIITTSAKLVHIHGTNFKMDNGYYQFLKTKYMEGVFLMHRDVMNKMGGFAPWRTSADTDFKWRFNALNKIQFEFQTATINKSLFNRRVWNGSLTQHPETNMQSKKRLEIRKNLRNFYEKEDMLSTDNFYILD